MLRKEIFVRFLKNYQKFDEALNRIDEALMGKKYVSNLYESDWADSVGYMLDMFLQSHFTEEGQDLINAYLFENCRELWVNIDKDLFTDRGNEHYTFNTFEELYDVMLKFKNDYFLNV